jgi:uncharacterized membrane protein YhaH (DUF805 family)
MSPTKLFFSADGRIGTRTFWRAIILLLAVQVVERLVQTVLPLAVADVYLIVSIVFLIALFVAYLSVYAKRLHDAGKGAGWFFLALLGFFIGSAFVIFGGLQVFAPEIIASYEDYFEAVAAGGSGSVEMQIFYGRIAEARFTVFAINLAGLFITNFVIGWLVARLPSDPGVNRFGPPEQGGDPDVFN